MKFLTLFLLVLAISSCGKENRYLSFTVKETANIPRQLDYVEVEWEMQAQPDKDAKFSISGKDGVFEGQLLSSKKGPNGQYSVTGIFPVSIGGKQTNLYSITKGGSSPIKKTLLVKGTGSDLTIDNDYFLADLTKNPSTMESSLSSGQVRSLMLKNDAHTLLKRSHINMHWSPNFQSTGREYRTMSHILDPTVNNTEVGAYKTTLLKEGKVADYPEIKLQTSYEFYAGLPYFVFSSEIFVEKDIELFLLRNDEMTLDSLFTHLLFKDSTTKMIQKPLYEKTTFSELKQNPISDNAPWLAFYNEELKLVFGCIRLEYNNKNIQGKESPLYLPHSKITAVNSDGGRYWNRRLIHEKDTLVPKGSRYYEKNVYFFMETGTEVGKQIDSLYQRVSNPLIVAYP